MNINSDRKINNYIKIYIFTLVFTLLLPSGFGLNFHFFVIDRRLLILIGVFFLFKAPIKFGFPKNKPNLLFFFFLIIVVLSAFFSAVFSISFFYVIQYILFALLPYYLVYKRFTVKDYEYLLNILLFVSIILAIILISENIITNNWYIRFFNNYTKLLSGEGLDIRMGLRSQGPFRHPIFASIHMAAMAVVAFAFYLFKNKNEKKAYLFIIIIFFGAILSTGSRGGLVSFIITFIVFFLINKKGYVKVKHFIKIIAVGILFFILFPSLSHKFFVLVIGGLFPQVLSNYDYQMTQAWNMDMRASWLPIIINNISKYGLIGYGFGVLSASPQKLLAFSNDTFLQYFINVYPYYLTILIEIGIIGLFVFIFFIFSILVRLMKILFSNNVQINMITLSIIGFVIVYLLGWMSVNFPFELQIFYPLITFSKFYKKIDIQNES